MLTSMIVVSAEKSTENTSLDDTKRQKALERMEALRTLEIIPDYYDYNVEMDKEVTRADFADAVAKLTCANNYSGKTSYFYDVPMSHWAYQSICGLAERQILSGTGEHIFSPNASIKTIDAIKILLCTMGYEDYVKMQGGYPSGYSITAAQIKISQGISMDGMLTNSDMFLLLYQAMTTEMLKPNHMNSGSISYELSDDTLLSMYHNVYLVKDILNGANGVSLTSGSLGMKNKLQIGDIVYESDIDLYQYLGEKIEALYYWDEKRDIKTVVWAESCGTSKVLNIDVDNDASFDLNSFRITYSKENGSTAHVNFAHNGVLIYNGGLVADMYDDYFNRDMYQLKLVAVKGGTYDVAIIQEYRNMVVGSIDSNHFKIYDKRDISNTIELDANEYTSLQMKNVGGVDISFADIQEENVLSIYESADGEYLEVVASSKTVDGTLESIGKTTNGYELKVNGNTYFYPQKEGAFLYSTGQKVILHLDIFDRCAYIETDGTNDNVAYLRSVYIGDSGENLFIKVLHNDGKTKHFECANKVTIDGVRYKEADKAYANFLDESGNIKEQLVLLTQNADGKVTKIDTAAMGPGEGDGNLQMNVDRITGMWRQSTLDGRMAIGSSTVIFVIPPKGTVNVRDDDYMILNRGETPGYQTMTASSYKTTTKVGCEQYVVLEWDPSQVTSYESVPILIQEIQETYDEDEGEVVEQIKGYQGSKEVTYMAGKGMSFKDKDIDKGSLIQAAMGRDGKVIAAKLIVNLEKVAESERGYTSISDSASIQRGVIIDVVDGVLKIDARDDSMDPNGWYDSDDIRMDCSNATVLIWDSQMRKDNIYVGNAAEALPGDYAVIDNMYGNARTVIVYK